MSGFAVAELEFGAPRRGGFAVAELGLGAPGVEGAASSAPTTAKRE